MDPLTGILAGAATGLLGGLFDNSDDVAQAQIDAANQGYASQAAALEKQQALQKAMLILQLMQQQQQGPLSMGAQLAGSQAGLDTSTQLYNDQMRQDIPNRIAQLGAYPALGTIASMLGLPAYEFPTSFEVSQIQTPNLTGMTKTGAAAVQPYFNFDNAQIAQILSDPSGYLSSLSKETGTTGTTGTIPSTLAPVAAAPQTVSLVPKQYEFDVTKTPGYQFRMDQAMDRADKTLAARGLSGSSVGMRFRADTSSDLAGKEFDNQLTRLQNYFNTAMGRSVSNPTTAGQGIAGNVSQAGQNLSSAFNDAAKARTSAIGTTGTNLSSMIGDYGALGTNLANSIGQANAYSASQPNMFQRILQGGLAGYGSSGSLFPDKL